MKTCKEIKTESMTSFTTRWVAVMLFQLVLSGSAWQCMAALNVVATLPDFGALAESLGENQVRVQNLARGTEDAHFVDAKPSFIRILNQADLLLEGGLELEGGWLPPLLNQARNPRIKPGATGYVDLSQNIPLLDIAARDVDRSQGDVHPGGNPHYWLDPLNTRIMNQTVLRALQAADPANASAYESRAKVWEVQWERHLSTWEKKMVPLRGTKVLTYHRSFDYLLTRYGLEIAGTLEPKPGIEPSPTHLKSLISQNQNKGVRWVLLEPFRPIKTAEYVAQSIGAKVLVLPDKVGGAPGVTNSFALFDTIIGRLTDEPVTNEHRP